MCSSPSMPPRSTKAPYSVMFLIDAAQRLALRERSERLLFFQVMVMLDERPAGQHHVAAPGVHLDDLHVEDLADERVEVVNRLDVDLRAGQESSHSADVHGQSALGRRDDLSLDRRPGLVGLVQMVPDLELLGLFPGEHEIAVRILGCFEHDLEFVAGLERLQLLLGELFDGNDPVGFVPQVQHDHARADLQHPAPHQRPGLKAFQGLVIEFLELRGLGSCTFLRARCLLVCPS